MGEKLEPMRQKLEQAGIKELRADGGYDARLVFSLLAKLGITPIIRAYARAHGVDRARALAVIEQLGGGRSGRAL